MSKPVPVYGGSLRPCSPACVLLSAARCLAASRIAPPVHGVSTTPVTTPDPGDQHQLAGQDADPASQDLSLRHLEYEIGTYGCAPTPVRPMANVHALSGTDRVNGYLWLHGDRPVGWLLSQSQFCARTTMWMRGSRPRPHLAPITPPSLGARVRAGPAPLLVANRPTWQDGNGAAGHAWHQE
jgi:hypothetical protein